MTWGPSLAFLNDLKEMGQDPPALRDRPQLEHYLAYYTEVFIEVKDSRGYSMGGEPLPLPVSEILAYCLMYKVEDLHERERISYMVRALDQAYRKVAADQAEAARNSSP